MAVTIAGDGTEIYYETWGHPDGDPLVFVPGLAVDRRIWACQRLVFGRRYRCIALDNRGSGRSGKPTGPYSLAQMADDIGSVLDTERITGAHLVGYSMGSQAAALLTLTRPDLVATLTLVGSACTHHQWRRQLLAEWSDLATRRGVHVMARRALPWLVGSTGRRFSPVINLMWPVLLSQPAHAFTAQVDALLAAPTGGHPRSPWARDGARLALGDLEVPTLVITGAQDRLTPVADAAGVSGLIPGSRLEVVPAAGHGVMIEAAPAFNMALSVFLSDLHAPRPGVSSKRPAAALP